MAYKALYRTYRPTTFEEVAGQQHIVKTLKNAINNNKIAHAYLFTGPRGTGKTTMAKLLAKSLNCEHGIGCQCNECKNCLAINEGSHPDVIEIDAASNNGVEEVRDLIEKVKYGTILGRYKVYIIDEVHMMSTGAFNALLKTLEEPPEHVVFILATTEPNKILPTILSRCQRYDFSKLSDNEIKERIKEVLVKENIEYNGEAVDLIISLSDGGMRDALSLLDQVLAYSNNVLNPEDILEVFSIESKEEKIGLISSIAKKDLSDVLLRFNNYINKGTDIKRLTNDLLQILKDFVIFLTTKNEELLTVIKKDDVRYMQTFLNNKTALKMVDELMSAIKDFKNVNSVNTLFEITLLKLANIETIVSNKNDEIIEEKEVSKPSNEKKEITVEKKEEIKTKVEETKEEKDEQMSLFDEDIKDINPVISNNIIYLNNSRVDQSFVISDQKLVEIMVLSKKEIKKELLNKWNNIKKLALHPVLGKTATLLFDGHPLVASKNILIMEYQTKTLAEKVNKIEMQNSLQDVVFNSFGRKMFVYALSRMDSIKFQNLYMNLLQINKLPKEANITLDMVGE
ncbi:MAG: DNA polymerase III subunit gamma/tau [Bacilli bacterium]